MFARKATSRLVCLWGLLAAFSLSLGAQETPSPEKSVPTAGLVRTAQGVPVPGATVRLVHLASGRAWVSWTDENGKFQFPGLPAGRYRIEAQQLGFEPASKEVEFAAAAPAIELTIRVAPLASLTSGAATKAPAEAAAGAKNETARTPETAATNRPPSEQPTSTGAPMKPGPGRQPGAKRPGQQIP